MRPLEARGDPERIAIGLLLEGVFQRYGYDFRDYAPASLRRRILARVEEEGLASVSALQERILADPGSMAGLLGKISISVTSMFRDPGFYAALRRDIVPYLKTYPFIRVWHAGCATGEEVYSLAILLHEEGILPRCRIYATDINEAVLEKARAGIFPLSAMKQYTDNHLKSGGRRPFSEYYTAGYDGAIFHSFLRENVVFSRHDLAREASFNEFNLILCRNTLIYFNPKLQGRALGLLAKSLAPNGYLALGSRESLHSCDGADAFEDVDARQRIYRRVA